MKSNSSSQPSSHSRRRFLKGVSATAATGTIGFPAIVRGKNLNEKLDIAIIGCGGRGGSNMGAVSKTENIVALIDVNARNLQNAAKRFPKASKDRKSTRLNSSHVLISYAVFC